MDTPYSTSVITQVKICLVTPSVSSRLMVKTTVVVPLYVEATNSDPIVALTMLELPRITSCLLALKEIMLRLMASKARVSTEV